MRVIDGCMLIAVAGFLGGCMSDEYLRTEGLTTGAGEAMYANTVMQMVDPWQHGVQDSDLAVPAARGGTPAPAARGGGSTTTSADD